MSKEWACKHCGAVAFEPVERCEVTEHTELGGDPHRYEHSWHYSCPCCGSRDIYEGNCCPACGYPAKEGEEFCQACQLEVRRQLSDLNDSRWELDLETFKRLLNEGLEW